MSNKLNRVVRNPYVFSIISKVLVMAVGFLFTVVQARYLGTAIKGQVAYVASFTSITSIVFGFGMHQAYPYYRKQSGEDLLPVFIKIALIQLLIYSFVSAALAFAVQDAKILAIVLITPVMVYDRIILNITMVEEPNRKNTIELAVSVAELLLIVLLWFGRPASFAVGVAVVAFKDAVMAVLYTWHWRARLSARRTPLRQWPLRFARFGFFPMLALLMTTLNYRVDVIMLEGRVADAAIGVYSVGVMLAERIWLIPDAMKGVMVSRVAKGRDAGEVAFVIRVCNAACLLVALMLVLVGKPVIRFAFGAEYAEAYQVTIILLAGVFFMTYYKMIASYNIVMGKQVINFIFLGISVLGNILANAALIPRWGILGAGAASVISYGLCSLLFLIRFHRMTGIPVKDMVFLQPADFRNLKAKLRRKGGQE